MPAPEKKINFVGTENYPTCGWRLIKVIDKYLVLSEHMPRPSRSPSLMTRLLPGFVLMLTLFVAIDQLNYTSAESGPLVVPCI